MTGTSLPNLFTCLTLEAYSRLVFSSTGKASISALIIRVGPLPFFKIATTPFFPTPLVTVYPSASRIFAK